jgi:hypothetical protein
MVTGPGAPPVEGWPANDGQKRREPYSARPSLRGGTHYSVGAHGGHPSWLERCGLEPSAPRTLESTRLFLRSWLRRRSGFQAQASTHTATTRVSTPHHQLRTPARRLTSRTCGQSRGVATRTRTWRTRWRTTCASRSARCTSARRGAARDRKRLAEGLQESRPAVHAVNGSCQYAPWPGTSGRPSAVDLAAFPDDRRVHVDTVAATADWRAALGGNVGAEIRRSG